MWPAQKKVPVEERFWRFASNEGDRCWNWRGSKVGKGYGRIGLGSAGEGNILAHRLSYRMHKGDIPAGLLVMHSCDNPACVNPAHLTVGTYKDNEADMTRKGRRRSPTKITMAQADEIRMSTETGIALADRFGVTPSAITHVRAGRRRNPENAND